MSGAVSGACRVRAGGACEWSMWMVHVAGACGWCM